MPRVASLFLPDFATDRLRRIDARRDRVPVPAAIDIAPALAAIDATIDRAAACSAPRGGGWRPGARWARAGVQAQIDRMPAHQRPPARELGRRSEAAPHPFRVVRGDDGGATSIHSGVTAVGLGVGTTPTPLITTPLITTARIGPRVTIAAACIHARALGLAPGMALAQARALVPGLDVRDADPAGEAADLARLARHAARHWTPSAAETPDGLWLDLTGVAHLFGGEVLLCRRILRLLARLGVTARIAVADSAGAAHALARHGSERITLCPTGDEPAALVALPIAGLRLDDDLLHRLGRLGIDTIGDLASLPRAPLARRFGASPLTRLDQALGHVPEPIEAIVPVQAPRAELRFAEPLISAEPIAHALIALVADLVATLATHGLGARRLALVCGRLDGHDQLVRIGTARPTRDAAHLVRLLVPKIETIDPGFGIETLRLIATHADPLGAQAIPGDLAGAPATPDLADLIDTLAARLGARRLYRFAAVESDVPERSVRRADPLGGAIGWRRDWPRPTRMFTPPQPVDVMALLPDGVPLRFVWKGQAHRVVRGDGPERIYGEWWKSAREADAVRDYYQVENEAGGRFWLYRRGDGLDARTGDLSWHLQAMFG